MKKKETEQCEKTKYVQFTLPEDIYIEAKKKLLDKRITWQALLEEFIMTWLKGEKNEKK